jgi:hypothetical protein
MYIEVREGWRYRPGGRERVIEQLARLREEHGGQLPLRPDAPGLLARLWGTDPDDPDTGVHVMVWESREAAEAFRARGPSPEEAQRSAEVLDTSGARTRGLDGLAFAHR